MAAPVQAAAATKGRRAVVAVVPPRQDARAAYLARLGFGASPQRVPPAAGSSGMPGPGSGGSRGAVAGLGHTISTTMSTTSSGGVGLGLASRLGAPVLGARDRD